MFKYRSKSMWNNSTAFHLAVSAIIWVPLALLFLSVALESGNVAAYFLYSSVLIFSALFLYRSAYTKIRFPAVEVCSEHLILNLPMYKRSVYDLAEIKGAKFVLNALYFRHLGWPVIRFIASMPKEKQAELLLVLKGS